MDTKTAMENLAEAFRQIRLALQNLEQGRQAFAGLAAGIRQAAATDRSYSSQKMRQLPRHQAAAKLAWACHNKQTVRAQRRRFDAASQALKQGREQDAWAVLDSPRLTTY
jgi:hypothetical protein